MSRAPAPPVIHAGCTEGCILTVRSRSTSETSIHDFLIGSVCGEVLDDAQPDQYAAVRTYEASLAGATLSARAQAKRAAREHAPVPVAGTSSSTGTAALPASAQLDLPGFVPPSPPLPSPVPAAPANDDAPPRRGLVPILELLEGLDASSAIRTVARQLARRMLPDDEHRTWLHVAADVAQAEGVTLDELLGRTRSPLLSRARRRWWFEIRRATGRSYPELARVLGYDHSTIMVGIREHEARIDRETAAAIDRGEDQAAPRSERRRVDAA